jgi:hypothetical protein
MNLGKRRELCPRRIAAIDAPVDVAGTGRPTLRSVGRHSSQKKQGDSRHRHGGMQVFSGVISQGALRIKSKFEQEAMKPGEMQETQRHEPEFI